MDCILSFLTTTIAKFRRWLARSTDSRLWMRTRSSCSRRLMKCWAIRNSKCGILAASGFSTCGKPNKERATREIPFTLGDADGEGNGVSIRSWEFRVGSWEWVYCKSEFLQQNWMFEIRRWEYLSSPSLWVRKKMEKNEFICTKCWLLSYNPFRATKRSFYAHC